jgi:signal peptidase I
MSSSSLNAEKTPSWVRENVRAVCSAFVLYVMFTTFLFQPFNIPSESMLPTLKIGDFLFVSKYSYGYGRYALPFPVDLGPVVGEKRMLFKEPKRGDIIVFENETMGVTYIKRLIGLPGDTLQVKDSIVYLNGQPIQRTPAPDFVDEEGQAFPTFIETLPNGVSYSILEKDGNAGQLDNTPLITIPPEMYFMMGDNRDRSADSRDPALGLVHRSTFRGRAERIFYSSRGNYNIVHFWAFPFSLRADRFFVDLRPFY